LLSIDYLDKFYRGVTKFGNLTKRITGSILIGIGVYFVHKYIFGVL